MGCHLDVHARAVGVLDGDLAVLDRDDAGEHQVFVGVFVVHAQQAAVGRALQRHEAHEVVVVAELAALGLGGLGRGVELGRIREQPVAPAQQDVGVITLGHVVIGVHARLDLGEAEGRSALRPGFGRGHHGQGADGRGNGRRRHRALQEAAPGKAGRDDLSHRAVRGRVGARPVGLLKPRRAEGGLGLVRHRCLLRERRSARSVALCGSPPAVGLGGDREGHVTDRVRPRFPPFAR